MEFRFIIYAFFLALVFRICGINQCLVLKRKWKMFQCIDFRVALHCSSFSFSLYHSLWQTLIIWSHLMSRHRITFKWCVYSFTSPKPVFLFILLRIFTCSASVRFSSNRVGSDIPTHTHTHKHPCTYSKM